MDKIKILLNATEFDIVKHGRKDESFKLVSIDKITSVLDETLTRLSNIQGNRYVKRLSKEVGLLHSQLIVASDCVD